MAKYECDIAKAKNRRDKRLDQIHELQTIERERIAQL